MKTDNQIQKDVIDQLKWEPFLNAVLAEKVKIKVEDCVVTLDGEVEWEYERNNAKAAIENLTGVRAVYNLIRLKPKINSSDIEQKIKAAFNRSASIDAKKVSADVTGSKVTLRGTVRSIAEKEDAEDAAWSTPGVTSVQSKLQIEDPQYALDFPRE